LSDFVSDELGHSIVCSGLVQCNGLVTFE